MDSTFGSGKRANLEETGNKPYYYKGNSIDMNSLKDISRNKNSCLNLHKERKENGNNNSIYKIQSDLNSFDLRKKSKSFAKGFKTNESVSSSNLNFDIDFLNKDKKTSCHKQGKFDIESFFNGPATNHQTFSYNHLDHNPNKLTKQSNSNIQSKSINTTINDITRDKASHFNNSFSLIGNRNNNNTSKSKIFKEISSYSETLKGKNEKPISNRMPLDLRTNGNRNDIKNDINFYFNFLSPTYKKPPAQQFRSTFNYDLNQKNGPEKKLAKEENHLLSLLISKQEKNNYQQSDLDDFTREFEMTNMKASSSLFQQKLNNVQSKIVNEKSYFK